jgi:hypothetical protein
MKSAHCSCQSLKEIEFSRQILEKYTNIKLHEKQSQREPSCYIWTDGQTDEHDAAETRFFSQFFEIA